MRQIKLFTGSRLIALAILATLAAILCAYQSASSIAVLEAQTPGQQRKARPRPKRPQTRVNKPPAFAGFKHESHREPKTKLNCSDCHTIPSHEAPDEIAAATKSGIKGFPYHDSCLECHRRTQPQFFSGATPTICTVCHTRVSPRATAQDVYARFPKQLDFTVRQFPGYFPHEKHRQVISDVKTVADVKQVKCVDCHKVDQRSPMAVAVGGDERIFTPTAGTFETSPDLPNDPPSAHSSCFGCHWETDNETKKPSKNNCRGCHRTPEEFAVQKHSRKNSLLSLMNAVWFKDWPREWPRRVSLKFRHEREEHKRACTSCHGNIVKTAALEIPDVTIFSCNQCHNRQKPVITDEMNAEDEDTNAGRNNEPLSTKGTHKCSGCHTTLIGSAPPPCSHFRLDEDKYLTGDYPKISARCPE